MPTKVDGGGVDPAHPCLRLLLCHCGKWAFRVDSHFPLFDRGPEAERPTIGCPIDWHVVPMPEPPVRPPTKSAPAPSISMDSVIVREIYSRQLLANEQGSEFAERKSADTFVFLREAILTHEFIKR
jgi:hypothetical protein